MQQIDRPGATQPCYELTATELSGLIRGITAGVRAKLAATPAGPSASLIPATEAIARLRAAATDAEEDAWDAFMARSSATASSPSNGRRRSARST